MAETRLEALKQALKMEEDGKAYYEQARKTTKNDMGKKIFESLIKAEEAHIRKIKELHASLEETGAWPDQVPYGDDAQITKNIFTEAMSAVAKSVGGTADDLEALKLAATMETKGKKFYESQAEGTDDPFEKKFYLLLAHEEGAHFISILDAIQFLEDPQAYYHQMEITKGFH